MAESDLNLVQTISMNCTEGGIWSVEIKHGDQLIVSICPRDFSRDSAQEICDFLSRKAGMILNPDRAQDLAALLSAHMPPES